MINVTRTLWHLKSPATWRFVQRLLRLTTEKTPKLRIIGRLICIVLPATIVGQDDYSNIRSKTSIILLLLKYIHLHKIRGMLGLECYTSLPWHIFQECSVIRQSSLTSTRNGVVHYQAIKIEIMGWCFTITKELYNTTNRCLVIIILSVQ